MKVSVNLKEIVIDQEDIAIQDGDIKIDKTKLIINFGYFKILEGIFADVRKGLQDFPGDFDFYK